MSFGLAFAGKSFLKERTNDRCNDYELVWEDNFEGSGIDYGKWSKIDRLYQAPWLKYMSPHPSLYKVSDGKLRLYARQNDGIAPDDTASILTGGVSTENKVTVRYGKVEVRARVRGATGAWPAIWLLANDREYRTYPIYAEIDFMEHYNKDPFIWQTVHNNYTDKLGFKTSPAYQEKSRIRARSFNTYGVEIRPDEIILSVNGKVSMKYPNLHTDSLSQYPYDCEKYLLIDMQVGNQWLKEIDLSDFPCHMDIDWVRFYRLK